MGQVGALVALRWRMVRRRKVRIGLLALAGLLPVLVVVAAVAGQLVPEGDQRFEVTLLAPTTYLVFAALAVVAPLVTGGGNELFPEGQLAAYPVQPRTVFLGSLLLAPLNLAWAVQVIGLAGVTAVVANRGPGVLLALLTLVAYLAFVTVAGQAVAWLVVGVRSRRAGRVVTRSLAAVAGLATGAVVMSGSSGALLDRAPTTRVVLAAIQGSQGRLGPWLTTTAALALGTTVALRLGRLACGWALRRPHATSGRPELAPIARRGPRRSMLGELVAVDLASVWRSTPLRRGVMVLAVLPGVVALLAQPEWSTLTMLPGLVAAGAGLLFGVNAFCLDGAGAAWVSTLPHPPRLTLLSKLVVTAETCLAAVVVALVVATARIRVAPTGAELLAVTGSALASTAVVVAICASLSVRRPHKADLRGPRDTPAPPATMAVYSLRLALATTWTGLTFSITAFSGSKAAAVAGTVAVLMLAVRSLVRTLREWSDPSCRAGVVTTVSFG